ncbi:estradiol 17-beta-dehydrogenase 8 [Coccinella septempunctata]|uniref:estradiol 17-beta-dehydrogenase 8 n=1 Tax=Coccinella septempunctata TaxID=41139 RepID=UPI001D081AC4|nr:estradiol 17-beta-dehydrogenase 8 [Coccinella septempunctata]XP_044759958.1 estradiol 17-beta-dehydrogenase 8 [Coccinella septempunctata]
MSLSGKTAFITGAGSGIGRAACQILSRDGANIIAADINVKNAQETLQLIEKPDKTNMAVSLNVSESTSVKTALKQVLETYNQPPSIIVNCAGITRDNFLLKLSEENFQEVMDVNLKGTFLVTQTFCNAIVEHKVTKGSVVNIASVVGKNGNIGQANYAASKAGVEVLTKTAAKELGREGIRVNAILPGFITTPMTELVPDKLKEMFANKIPLSRFGTPEEIAEVISFLASDKSSYITGASIDVNGGLIST